MYGLTDKGFAKKPYERIVEKKQEDYIEIFGSGINLEPQSPQGQLIGIESEGIYDVWEMAEHVYASYNIDDVSGALLDDRALLKGEKRFKGESDKDFRIRIKEQLPNSVMQLKDELRDNLQRITGVVGLDVKYKRGLTSVWVEGGSNIEIAKTILDYMPPGDLAGNTLVKTDDFCEGISFYRPVFIPVKIKISVQFFTHLECECDILTDEKIKSFILNNGCGLKYGEYLYADYIRNVIFSNFKGLKIEKIELSVAAKQNDRKCKESMAFNGILDFIEVGKSESVLLCEENIEVEWIESNG